MNGNELTIKDIHLPAAIEWWPPALGWWLLLILVPLAIAMLVWIYKRITQKTAIKDAKKRLLALKQDPQLTEHQKLCELSVLIRRSAISIYPRSDTAALTGQQWLALLDQVLPGQPFSQGIGKTFMAATYQKPGQQTINLKEVFDLCENWLKAMSKVKT